MASQIRLQALPDLAEVTAAFRDQGVVFYAVNQREGKAVIESFLQKEGPDLVVALDPEGEASGLYRVEGIPQTVLIGKDGTVEAVHVGLLPGLKSRLRRELGTLLRGDKLAAEE